MEKENTAMNEACMKKKKNERRDEKERGTQNKLRNNVRGGTYKRRNVVRKDGMMLREKRKGRRGRVVGREWGRGGRVAKVRLCSLACKTQPSVSIMSVRLGSPPTASVNLIISFSSNDRPPPSLT